MAASCNVSKISFALRTACILFTFVFLLFYGCIFWHLRFHFLISRRIPRVTIAAVLLLFYIGVYYVIVDYAVCYIRYPIDSVFGRWFQCISHGVHYFKYISKNTANTIKTQFNSPYFTPLIVTIYRLCILVCIFTHLSNIITISKVGNIKFSLAIANCKEVK